MKQAPQILSRQTVASSRHFRIEQQRLRFSNGVEVDYERLVSSPRGAVLIVPLLDNETVLLIREYAAGVERYELALPKGSIEADEPLLEAANREIQEEVGYAARRLQHIKSFSISPGYFSHMTHVVLAQDLYQQRLSGDEPETIEVVPWKLNELDKLLLEAECTEARSIAALFLVRDLMADTTRDIK